MNMKQMEEAHFGSITEGRKWYYALTDEQRVDLFNRVGKPVRESVIASLGAIWDAQDVRVTEAAESACFEAMFHSYFTVRD